MKETFGAGRPVFCIVGGVHGNEPSGAETARRLADFLRSQPELRGTVKVLPRANPDACGARDNPADGLNLNRCFPGDPSGSATMRLARFVWDWSADADLLIDLHDCAPGGEAYLLGVYEGASRALAKRIPLKYALASQRTRGQLFIESLARGQAAVIIEQPADGSRTEECLGALINMLRAYGVIPGEYKGSPPAFCGPRIREGNPPGSVTVNPATGLRAIPKK